jgi:hypothetical protein
MGHITPPGFTATLGMFSVAMPSHRPVRPCLMSTTWAGPQSGRPDLAWQRAAVLVYGNLCDCGHSGVDWAGNNATERVRIGTATAQRVLVSSLSIRTKLRKGGTIMSSLVPTNNL